MSERQPHRGYRHVADKFGVSGLTPVPADLIAPPLVAECPVVMECTVETWPRDTAAALGSGDVPVLGTPRLLALAEAATMLARLPA